MKANQGERECPKWCAAPHEGPEVRPFCDGEWHWTAGRNGMTQAAMRGKGPEITAYALCGGSAVSVHVESDYRAESLAQFIEAVAVMPRAEARELAANVRSVSAEIWPKEEAEAG